jgi:integrase/recombinase XerC
MNVPKHWGAAINEWVHWLRAGALRRATIDLRYAQIARFGRAHRDIQPWAITASQVTTWVGAQQWSAETIRSHRAALRSFFGWAHMSGYVTADPSRMLRRVKPAEINPRPAAEQVITEAMNASPDRIRLMIELGSRHGLRRGEICRIHSRDLVAADDGWWLTVHGKGGKERDVPLQACTARTLLRQPAGWVFGNGQGHHLSPAHCGKLVRRALTAAAGQRTTCHQLRHRYAAVTWRESRDLVSVQDLLGHASPVTTRRYVGGDRAVRRRVAGAA